MRVLWIIDGLGPGGAENMMPTLLKQLCERGVESRVCVLQVKAGNPLAEEVERLGIQVDVLNVARLRSPGNLPRLIRYVRQYQPDIIHTQLEASDIFGTLVAKILGIPTLTTLHTLDVKPKTKRSYWRNLIRWRILNSFCDQIIAVSEITRQHYVALGLRPEKIITLYNGVDMQRFIPFGRSEAKTRRVLDVPDDSIVMVTVAVLREAKGIQYMLQAMPAILKKFPNAYYVVVGDGAYGDPLKALVASLSIEGRVLFLGHRSDIPAILAESDLFVFPTLMDALPTVLLEAMAVGKPIVSSRVGGIPEILEHEVNALLIRPATPAELSDSCIRVLSDRDLKQRLSASARNAVEERFDVRKQAGILVDTYGRLASEHAN